jgi:hypothetical protein
MTLAHAVLLVIVIGTVALALGVDVGVVVAWLAGHRFWGIIGLNPERASWALETWIGCNSFRAFLLASLGPPCSSSLW